ncbi:MAG: hypothetical protein ABSG17_14270 [Spirochaetia bacterium]|jgi:Tol biopolymer transport system component
MKNVGPSMLPALTLILALAAGASLARPAPLDAQALQWEQAETEHFLFVFEPQDRHSVDELLTFCEPVYQRITGFFHSYPKKVRVVIRGRIDEANGFTTFLPPHIELYLTAPTDHFLGARTESWLKILLTHELTHYVHASMDRGFFYALSRVFGPDAAGAHFAFLPGWMIEGPSTNTETIFTAGGRGRNPLFEMYSKAPVEEGKLFNLEQAAYGSSFPPPGRIYVGGYTLVDFLLSTYGRDAFQRIMDAYLGFPFFGPWSAISKVTGKSASEVFDSLKKHMEKKYRPDVGVPAGSLITPRKPGDWIHPQATARGLYVYHTSQDHFPAIVRYDPASGREEILHAVIDDGLSFTATRDGKTLYFTSQAVTWIDPVDEQEISDLYRLEVDTGRLRQLTHGAHIWQPCVSQDGTALVAVQGSGPYSRIVSVDQETGSLRVLFSRSEANVYTPAFSPDGRRLAFTLNVRGFQDVYVADYQGLAQDAAALPDIRSLVTDMSQDAATPVLGPDPFGEYFPSFLDNNILLFSSDRGGSLALYRADLASKEVARVIDDPVAAISAIPNGDALLYSSYSSDGWCLKSVPLERLEAEPLAQDQLARQEYPAAYSWTGAAAASRPYHDWPGPLLWLPYPSVTVTAPGAQGVELGLGAAVYGASLLGTTTWLADAGWFFASRQPFAGLTVTSTVGPFLAGVQSQLVYQFSSNYSQTVTSNASLTLPVINSTGFDVSRFFAVSLGLEHLAELDSSTPFTFTDSTGPLSGGWQNGLFVTSGVSWQLERMGGAIDFNSPFALSGQVQNATRLPVLSYPAPESDFLFQVGLNVPSVFPHQVIKLGVKATEVFGGPFTQYTDSFAVPRGFPGPSTRSVPGQALASIDYAIPIALFDQPLAFSISSTGAGLALHVEGIGRWSAPFQDLSLDPSLYVGGDVTFQMVFNAIPFGALAGVAARINTRAPGTFQPGRDIGVYLGIGSQSIANGQSNAGGSRVGSPWQQARSEVPSWLQGAHGKTGT